MVVESSPIVATQKSSSSNLDTITGLNIPWTIGRVLSAPVIALPIELLNGDTENLVQHSVALGIIAAVGPLVVRSVLRVVNHLAWTAHRRLPRG